MKAKLGLVSICLLAGLLVVGCPRKSHPPDAPSVPIGPSAVGKDSLAGFSSSATNPDGDSVRIRFDWGDGDTSDWSHLVASGESVAMTHAWSKVGLSSARAQADNQSGMTSAWSSGHAVSIIACWSRSFDARDEDCGYSVQQTSDGGYVVVGVSWLIKTDADGNMVWDRALAGGDDDYAFSVRQTSDGGYIVTGYTYCDSTRNNYLWLTKTDAYGNQVWNRIFGGGNDDCGRAVVQTSDGGYVTAGWTESESIGDYSVWLMKTDANGNKVWDRTFGGESDEEGYSVQQTPDGGYIVAGYTYSFGAVDADAWLIKTDADGEKVWDKTFGGDGRDYGYSVQQTPDGGYIVVGSTESYSLGHSDVWLIKTDADGNKTWDKTFGGNGRDEGNSVQQTSDGGYIVVGSTESYGAGGYDVWLMKTDADGNMVRDRTFGGADNEFGYSVQQTSDGGYIVAGQTYTDCCECDALLIKTLGP